MTLIKSISGIRGTIGGRPSESLTPIDIVKFTYAYSDKLRERRPHPDGSRYKVVVGKDARLSGEMVEQLVCGTLVACGVDVVMCGFASTPTTELAVTFANADGGIILTASHNPRQWNALKLLNKDGEFLNAAEGGEVLRIAEAEADKQSRFAEMKAEAEIAERLRDVEVQKAEFKRETEEARAKAEEAYKIEQERIRKTYETEHAAAELTRPVSSLSPLEALAQGECVEPRRLAQTALVDLVVLPLAFALLAGFALPRKQDDV